MPDHAEALAWLQEQGVQDADSWLREQGGAPLAALAQSNPAAARSSIPCCSSWPARASRARCARRQIEQAPLAQLVAWQQRWLYDVFSYKLSARIRYYPRYRKKELAAWPARCTRRAADAAIKSANERRAVADHPLSPKLFVEDMLLDYTALRAVRWRPKGIAMMTQYHRPERPLDPGGPGRPCCRLPSRKKRRCTPPTCPS
jgi:DNA polymerase-3 subunit delta'